MKNLIFLLSIVFVSFSTAGQAWADENAEDLIDLIRFRNYERLPEAIALGADVNAQDAFGQTALHYAVKNILNPQTLKSTVKVLLQAGADWTLKDNKGKTATQVRGLSKANKKIVKKLIQKQRIQIWWDWAYKGTASVGGVTAIGAVAGAYWWYQHWRAERAQVLPI